MKVRELLSDETKWLKGDYSANGRYCLRGAINACYAVGSNEKYAVMMRVRQMLDDSITNWNDAPERTFSDVRALIEQLDI